MTSLEWSTLWRISEGTQLWAPTKNGPVIHFSNSYFNRIAGNHSATAALLDRGMVSTAPRGRPRTYCACPISWGALPGYHDARPLGSSHIGSGVAPTAAQCRGRDRS